MDFKRLLRDGFKKTGIFPYDPDIISAGVTVPAKLDELSLSLPPTWSPQKRKFREALHEMNISDELADRMWSDAERAARGESIGSEIAKSFAKALLSTHTKKQKRVKDQRFSTDHGLVMTSEHVKALEAKGLLGKKKTAPVTKTKKAAPKKENSKPVSSKDSKAKNTHNMRSSKNKNLPV